MFEKQRVATFSLSHGTVFACGAMVAKPASPTAIDTTAVELQINAGYSIHLEATRLPILSRYCCSFEAQRLHILTRIRSHGLVIHSQPKGDRKVLPRRAASQPPHLTTSQSKGWQTGTSRT
jgi:hypothetical protein